MIRHNKKNNFAQWIFSAPLELDDRVHSIFEICLCCQMQPIILIEASVQQASAWELGRCLHIAHSTQYIAHSTQLGRLHISTNQPANTTDQQTNHFPYFSLGPVFGRAESVMILVCHIPLLQRFGFVLFRQDYNKLSKPKQPISQHVAHCIEFVFVVLYLVCVVYEIA